MQTLVLIRHGQSTWNQTNRFTGWVDVPLSERGIQEACDSGKTLREAGHVFDVAFTSYLARAIHTLDLVLEEMGSNSALVTRDWRLNERHYGSLQGLNKRETANKFGEEQVLVWRRSFSVRPPELSHDDPSHPRNDPLYKDVPNLPNSESLADTFIRIHEWWEDALKPSLLKGQKVLVVAHGNSLRALVKLMENLSEEKILALNIPTGIPISYQLNGNLDVLSRRFLASEDVVKAAVEEVFNQGSRK